MIVIIDGYNLLKNIFSKYKDDLAKQRDAIVKQLGLYKHKKGADITEIVIVFDGGLTDKASREVKNGIVVIFSGRGKSADRWIEKWIERNKHHEILLVTNDRELYNRCENKGASSIRIHQFYAIVQGILFEADTGDQGHNIVLDTSITKFESEPLDEGEYPLPMYDKKAFDLLMEQASLQYPGKKEEDDESNQAHKPGSAHTLSKEEKKRRSKIKKLL